VQFEPEELILTLPMCSSLIGEYGRGKITEYVQLHKRGDIKLVFKYVSNHEYLRLCKKAERERGGISSKP
jgi:hypothetical protein